MGFSLARLAPNFKRLNPANKLKTLPGNNMAHFLQAAVMIPVMFWLTWALVRDRLPDLLRLPLMPVRRGATRGMLIEGCAEEGFVRSGRWAR
jgi:flagellar biosynthesis protein FlhB